MSRELTAPPAHIQLLFQHTDAVLVATKLLSKLSVFNGRILRRFDERRLSRRREDDHVSGHSVREYTQTVGSICARRVVHVPWRTTSWRTLVLARPLTVDRSRSVVLEPTLPSAASPHTVCITMCSLSA